MRIDEAIDLHEADAVASDYVANRTDLRRKRCDSTRVGSDVPQRTDAAQAEGFNGHPRVRQSFAGTARLIRDEHDGLPAAFAQRLREPEGLVVRATEYGVMHDIEDTHWLSHSVRSFLSADQAREFRIPCVIRYTESLASSQRVKAFRRKDDPACR
jgi:hypothetical protein